ncbi:MAG: hypothetical protein II794_07900, partial [Oscillospiraceae bacterium]|nr:hypothetical protein [Oscillospiraceae bacterium]
MTEIISVKFKNKGKAYFFDPAGITAAPGDRVVVETAKGPEYVECVAGNRQIEDNLVRQPLRPVLRLATAEDDRRAQENRRREQEAMVI